MVEARPAPAAPATPLGELLAGHARARAAFQAQPWFGALPPSADAGTSRVAEESLAYLRRTWSTLQASRRLAQSQAALPDSAGPLNSHHLVHRALTAMNEISPAYLARFIAEVEALLWIEQANARRRP